MEALTDAGFQVRCALRSGFRYRQSSLCQGARPVVGGQRPTSPGTLTVLALSLEEGTPSGMTQSDQEAEALRRMTPAQKLTVMHALIRQAYELKAAAVRTRWPHMSEEEVWTKTRTLVGGDCP